MTLPCEKQTKVNWFKNIVHLGLRKPPHHSILQGGWRVGVSGVVMGWMWGLCERPFARLSSPCQLLSGASCGPTIHVGIERMGCVFVRGGAGQGSDAAYHKTYGTLRKGILVPSICAAHTHAHTNIITHSLTLSDQAWFAHVFKYLNNLHFASLDLFVSNSAIMYFLASSNSHYY